MISTLDHIQTLAHDRSWWWWELVRFGCIFAWVSVLATIVTNFSLFRSSLYDMMWWVKAHEVALHTVPQSFALADQSSDWWDVWSLVQDSWVAFSSGDRRWWDESGETTDASRDLPLTPQDQKKLDHVLKTHDPVHSDQSRILAESLKESFSSYRLWFNTLPNQARVIIDRIAVNVPVIIPSLSKPIDQINEGEFDVELYKGVVKYPTTAIPWATQGATLLFGHTSYEEWKHNPYANVFRNIPRLQAGDTIRVIREWHEYTYRVTEKKVIRPRDVNAEFLLYHNQSRHHVILMGCYPIGTTDKRILVIAERL